MAASSLDIEKEQIEKAREYLRNIKTIGNSLSFLEDRIKFYETLCEKCTSVISDMPRGSAKNTEDLYIKLVEMKKKYNDEFLKNGDSCTEAYTLIESLKNERHRALLHYYYIERMKLYDVGIKIGVSYPRVKEIHQEALRAFSKILDEEGKI